MTSGKSRERTFSIYVRFRKRRLGLMKRIGSLETAWELLCKMRAERFHDAHQLFLIDDVTGEEIDDRVAGPEPRPPASEGPARADPPSEGPRRAPAPVLTTLWLDGADAVELWQRWPEPTAAPPSPEARAAPELPLTRLQRSVDAAREARRRYAAAVAACSEALLASRPGLNVGDDALRRLMESSRALDDLGGRAIAALDEIALRLARTRHLLNGAPAYPERDYALERAPSPAPERRGWP